ncbi:ATP-binding protein [Nostoc sp. ATCC 53789]|uniref:sensor histidine kinase n=1 Tax=Nostoc sp. ATCC 53789 TaxID=76335 RepID=UPI000DED218B|nr:ATP-binding protein [Nostoc sp. ATCC 53789]QHG18074.1 sensor histidine kinase [Nostoc sp. ATCC 53789]RCJ29745.1 histidine kinase [Nostoc sp. ATCC 53789]
MYDLQMFTMRDMSECGLALRSLGKKANSMEEVGNHIVQYLYNNLIDLKSGERSCALVRFFKTHSYGELPPKLQEYTHSFVSNDVLENNLKCLTLLSTAGQQPEWNSRHKSEGHKVIPLFSKEMIAQIPMIFQLIQQLGLNLDVVVRPDLNLLTDLEQRMYNVFYVPDALGSSYIPSQTSFVIPYNIKSVVGVGGLLPSGNIFIIIMFLKVAIPRISVDLLRPLALNVKMTILPFENEKTFTEQEQHLVGDNISTTTDDETFQYLNSQITTLNQLLDVSEQSTISQSDRLEQTNASLQETLKKLQSTQIQLVHNEKMSSLGKLVAGIAHEINNPVNFIYGNLSYAKEYTHSILKIIQKYQNYYPDPPEEIKKLVKENDLDFLIRDLTRTFNSMTVGTERITEIVSSLRNFSRLDEAEIKQVYIHEGIDSTLMILKHFLQATDKTPEIEVVKQYSQLPLIECYPAQINQAFMNIITNAIDALQDSGKSWFRANNQLEKPNFLLPVIRISTEVIDPEWVAITIADNGCGMNEKVRARLFDPFFTTKPVGKGTGLGLSISYQIIVEQHRGKIGCISVPEQGTEFVIKIPVKTKNV